jgi:hypothetical protein
VTLEGNADVYNAMNASTVLSVGTGLGQSTLTAGNVYGPRWRLSTLIADGRIFQFSAPELLNSDAMCHGTCGVETRVSPERALGRFRHPEVNFAADAPAPQSPN